MTQIEFRRMDFCFEDDIPYHFNSRNLPVSNGINSLTFLAPAFETYFIKAFRDVMPLLKSDQVRADAKLFIQQERQHSKHHIAHLNMLLRKFPELEQTRDDVNASYEALYEAESLKFHLAYTATIELAFGPTARFIIDNRDALFGGGDERISSFVLWHFVEEFEHRNCAIDVYNDVVGSYLYRLRQVPATRRHLAKTGAIVRQAVERLVAAGKIPQAETSLVAGATAAAKRRLTVELLETLTPWHKPERLRPPQWAEQWLADHKAGKPMVLAYKNPAGATGEVGIA